MKLPPLPPLPALPFMSIAPFVSTNPPEEFVEDDTVLEELELSDGDELDLEKFDPSYRYVFDRSYDHRDDSYTYKILKKSKNLVRDTFFEEKLKDWKNRKAQKEKIEEEFKAAKAKYDADKQEYDRIKQLREDYAAYLRIKEQLKNEND